MGQSQFEKREFVDQYLREHPCLDCGESDILCLDFDHVYGLKYKNISTMIRDSSGIELLKDEISKCVVRCANCHRRRHRLEDRGIEE